MSTYTDTEDSSHDAAPVEGFKFTGTYDNYYYTSADQDETIAGNLYTAVPIKRNAIRSGSQNDDSLDLELEVPSDLQLVRDYGYGITPPELVLEVVRYHRGTNPATDFAVVWKGPVTSFSTTGKLTKIQVPSIFTVALQGELPNAYFQNPCNHVLYDVRCKVDPNSYKQATTITAVTDETTIEVADDGFADEYLRAGEFYNVTKNERRTIVDNVANVITVSFPFFNPVVGDSVELFAGCDHGYQTCINKFNNSLNYGGFPFVPADNPFRFEL